MTRKPHPLSGPLAPRQWSGRHPRAISRSKETAPVKGFCTASAFVSSGCRNKISQRAGLEQQAFIFSQFERLEVQDQGVSMEGFWCELSSRLAGGCHLAVSHMAEREKGSKLSSVSSYKGANSNVKTPASNANNLSKAPSPNTTTLGFRVSTCELAVHSSLRNTNTVAINGTMSKEAGGCRDGQRCCGSFFCKECEYK